MIKVANKRIGEKYPTFIIAEGGVNHNGCIKIAKQLILAAKKSGADAIKFQTFKATDLTSKNSKYYKLFKKLELSNQEFIELGNFARKKNIIFLSTPFSNDAVDLLHHNKIVAFKIASGDLTDIPLIRYASSKNKPMIISTGMGTIEETMKAVKAVESQGNKKIILLHSVSAYPTPYEETNLRAIIALKNEFRYPIGYSDNGNNLLVPLIAVAMGAKVIEKHFTISKKLKGPDHKMSAEPDEFKKMVKEIRIIEKMLGTGKKQCQPSEFENLVHARRSITANITIPKGAKIDLTMLNLKRPANGIEPEFLNKILGKNSKRIIHKDESIKWKDIR